KSQPIDFVRIFALVTRLMLLFRPRRLLLTGGSALLLLGFLEYRYDLTPIDMSATRFAGMSSLILALAGLVEFRSYYLRVPGTMPARPTLRERIASSRGLRILGSVILLLSLAFFLPRDKILDALRQIQPRVLAVTVPLLLA